MLSGALDGGSVGAAGGGLESGEEFVHADGGVAKDSAEGAEGDFFVKRDGNGKALRVG